MKKYLILIFILISVAIYPELVTIPDNERSPIIAYSAVDLYETEITFNLKEYEFEKITINDKEYSRISIFNEGELLAFGKPELPTITRLFTIPDRGEVDLEINWSQNKIVDNVIIYPEQPLRTESSREEIPFTIDTDYYAKGGLFPQQNIVIGDPVIFRDHRIVTVTFNPFQYDPVSRELKITENINLTLSVSGRGGINIKESDRKRSWTFEKLYKAVITNYDQVETRNTEYQVPSYLFIYPDDTQIESYLQDLLDWKHQKGFHVTAVSTAITGTNLISITNYIQDAYDNWDIPPEFICLVGDAGGAYNIPTGHYVDPPYSGEGDQIYTLLEGDDILADAILGRLSFNSTMEFLTILSKILNYEKTPYVGDPDWFNRTLMVGDPLASGQSCIDTKMYISDLIDEYAPHYANNEIYSGNWVTGMTNGLNEGVSYFNYRGFVGMSGWQINHINNLNNGFMMPLAVSLTCLTGDFEGTGDCISERFLKAGTPTVPKGAIAAISTATGNTHTCFNNCLDAGIFSGIFADRIYNPGGALVRGKLHLYNTYPGNPFNYVSKFSYWNNLMGDPGLDLWTATPEELVLNFNSEIPIGSNNIEITVTDIYDSPVEDVWVTILKGDDEIFISDRTDEFGQVLLPVSANSQGLATITATKHNYIPETAEINIFEAITFVNIYSSTIDDDNTGNSLGNGDGLVNPGEIVELTVELMNYGSIQVDNVVAVITSDSPYLIILNDQGDFGTISPGGSSSSGTFLLEISEGALGDQELILEIEITGDSGNNWDDLITLVTYGPYLEMNGYTILDGGDNILQPGETSDLQLNVENIGITDLEEIYAILSCDDDRITLNDQNGYFGNITAGGEVSNSTDLFNITADNSLVPGTFVSFGIDLYNAQDFLQNNRFSLQVGEVSITDPLGPDNFGHYIYDNNDMQYINTVPFDWVEVDPNHGGSGTIINNLVDPGNMGSSAEIPLPFTMVFFGREYNEVTICTNGWFAPGSVTMDSFMNWGLPGPLGPSPMVAVFWDDLKMGDAEGTNYIPNGGSVCYYYDDVLNYFIIEWSRLRNEFDDHLETFQAIIYDPIHYPTSSGDCQILLQYYEISNTDQGSYETPVVNHGQYATIGIEDHYGTDGLQYTYNNTYPDAAMPIENMTALMISGSPISTDDPYIVFSGYELTDENGNNQFDYAEQVELSIALNNLGGSSATNVSATLMTEDEFITILNGSSGYDDISAGMIEYSLVEFVLQAADVCPDNHIATFNIEIQSDQGSVNLPLNIIIRAPLIILEEIIVEDSNNGILDPGETSPISFVFRNIGGSDSEPMNALIEFTSDMVTTDINSNDIGILTADSFSLADFEFSADPLTEIGTEIVITWSVSDEMGYDFTGDISFYISQVPVHLTEEFDSFPPDGWEVEGGFNWLGSFSNGSGGTPPEALFWGGIPSQTTQRLISIPVNTLGSNQLVLEFRQSVNPLGDGFSVGVETSDDGVIWNNVVDYGSAFINFSYEELIIETPDVGSNEFMIAFYFEGDTQFLNYWAIDDILLYHVPITPQSFILGTTTLADGNGNVQETLISAGDFTTSPNSEGEFVLQVDPGIYDITAYLPGYFMEVYEDFEVPLPWESHYIDFTLNELTVDYPPQNLSSELDVYNVYLLWDPPGSNVISSFRQKDLEEDNFNTSLDQRSQTGYNIYRNNELLTALDDISILEYYDIQLDSGDYEYYVTAVFEEGETNPSNSVLVNVILPPPADLTVTVTPSGGNVILNWEVPNVYVTGFRIYRNGEFLIETLSSYYFDAGVDPGTYLYEVTALYDIYESEPASGEIEVTSSDDNIIPRVTELTGNHPNPFNPDTVIDYQLSEETEIELTIYNMKGQLVKILVDQLQDQGMYSINWDGTDLQDRKVSSGIYYYRMYTRNYTASKKMILMK